MIISYYLYRNSKIKEEELKKYVKNLRFKSRDHMMHISEITKEAKNLLNEKILKNL